MIGYSHDPEHGSSHAASFYSDLSGWVYLYRRIGSTDDFVPPVEMEAIILEDGGESCLEELLSYAKQDVEFVQIPRNVGARSPHPTETVPIATSFLRRLVAYNLVQSEIERLEKETEKRIEELQDQDLLEMFDSKLKNREI